MSKHSKAPWVKNRHSQILDSNGQRVRVDGFAFGVYETDESQANDDRIIACVNACESFTTEELQGVDLCKNKNDTEIEISELRKQRDELVSALRVALNALEEISGEMTVGDRFTNAGQYMIDALPIARAAMKKIGGEV